VPAQRRTALLAGKADRRDAGRKVAEIAQAFSDSLLADEVSTFAVIDQRLRVKVDTARSAVLEAGRRVKGDVARLPSQAAMFATVVAQHRAGVAAGVPEVRGLARTASEKARGSIQRELFVCQTTLGGKYDGLAAESLKATRGQTSASVEFYVGQYVMAAGAANDALEGLARQQVRAAQSVEEVVERLFSPEPLRLPGNGGRGVWWQSTSTLHAAARHVAISVANQVRQDAMIAFDDIGSER
jgi:hypothetical protein